jgi:transcriptional regulator with XRE-family HTH domain
MAFDRRGFYREVGLRLAMRRKERRATQQQVAAAIGVPRATYASIEGGRQRITIDVLWRAALVLDCPITALVPEAIVAAAPARNVQDHHDTHVSAGAEARVIDADQTPDTSTVRPETASLRMVG